MSTLGAQRRMTSYPVRVYISVSCANIPGGSNELWKHGVKRSGIDGKAAPRPGRNVLRTQRLPRQLRSFSQRHLGWLMGNLPTLVPMESWKHYAMNQRTPKARSRAALVAGIAGLRV